MSIATEITRLNNNIDNLKQIKQNIKTAVNNDFTEITNEQIEDYANKIKDTFELYKDQIPDTTTTKLTKIDIDDAMVYSKNKLNIFGRTEQTILTGKNLFNSYSYPVSETKNGITITNNGDGSFTLNGTCDKDSTIFTLGDSTTIKDLGNAGDVVQTAYYISGSCTKVSENTKRCVIRLNSNTAANTMVPLESLSTNLVISKTHPQNSREDGWSWSIIIGNGDIFNNFKIKYQLETGSTATDYEPYCGRNTKSKSRIFTRD